MRTTLLLCIVKSNCARNCADSSRPAVALTIQPCYRTHLAFFVLIVLHSAHSTRPTRASRTHPIPPRTLAVEQDFKLQRLFIPYDSCSEFASAAKSHIASRPTPLSFILGRTIPFHSRQVFQPRFCIRMFIFLCLYVSKQRSYHV